MVSALERMIHVNGYGEFSHMEMQGVYILISKAVKLSNYGIDKLQCPNIDILKCRSHITSTKLYLNCFKVVIRG